MDKNNSLFQLCITFTDIMQIARAQSEQSRVVGTVNSIK